LIPKSTSEKTESPANVVQALDEAARRHPDRVAFYFDEPAVDPGFFNGQITFAELKDTVERLAAAFYARGIHRGNRVALMAPMSIRLYIILLALFRLAATAILLEPFMGLKQVAAAIQTAEPVALITTPKGHLLRLPFRAFRLPRLKFVIGRRPVPGAETVDSLLREVTSAPEVAEPDENTPAIINFTSGNKGAPRAVDRSHQHLWAQHTALLDAFDFEPGDIDMSAFPIFPLHNTASGITTVLPARFSGLPSSVIPQAVVDQILSLRVTTIKGSPAFFKAIARHCLEHRIVLPSVRAILTGGAPVSPGLVAELKRIVPNGDVYVAYGSTEAEPIAGIAAAEVIGETGSLTLRGQGICAGHPLGATDVRIIKSSSGPVVLGESGLAAIIRPQGAPGEIAVAGRHINKAYFRDPEAVAESKIRDETGRLWHRTDDVGYFDDHGRLWLLGRLPMTVRRDGRDIYPLQVEPVIDGLDFVKRSAFFGVPDKNLCQRAVLVFAPRESSLYARIRHQEKWQAAVKAACASLGVPVDEVVVAKSIPLDRRRQAKIDYRRLRAWYRRPPLLRLLG